jgi:hypothetical protein
VFGDVGVGAVGRVPGGEPAEFAVAEAVAVEAPDEAVGFAGSGLLVGGERGDVRGDL